jgi:hypothetical protein
MIHDLTAWTGCINTQMIIYKRENEMHFRSKYLYVLNQLVTVDYDDQDIIYYIYTHVRERRETHVISGFVHFSS